MAEIKDSPGQDIQKVASTHEGDIVTTWRGNSRLHRLKRLVLGDIIEVYTYCGRKWSKPASERYGSVATWWDRDDQGKKVHSGGWGGPWPIRKAACARCDERFYNEHPGRRPKPVESPKPKTRRTRRPDRRSKS